MRRWKAPLLAMWVLGLLSGCAEDPLPPPPIATSGLPPEPPQTSAGDGADETGEPDPSGVACDVWQQNCPPSYKCSPFDPAGRLAWTESRCVPVDPSPVALGDGCTFPNGPEEGIDDCPADALCYFADVRGQGGQCLPLCTGGPEAPVCPEGMACGWGNDGAVALCRPTCDPLAQDCAPSNSTCLPTPSGTEFVCYVHQWDRGGSGCTAHNGCPSGSACVPAEWVDASAPPGFGRCASFCGGEAHGCPDGKTCKPWPDGSADGHPGVGVCALP
jgi:hypothetical protein